MRTNKVFLFILALFSFAGIARAEVRVAITPDNGRRDVLTREWDNWRIKDGPSATQRFGGLTVTLRPAGKGGALSAGLWKGALDTAATLGASGAFVEGRAMELVISGLPAGRHGIVTFHSSIWADNAVPFDIAVDGDIRVHAMQPSQRVTSNDDVASAYLDVDAQAGKDVVITFTQSNRGKPEPVILNGFEIDAANRALLAIKPSPADDDEHSAEDPLLSWAPAKSAASHNVYLGTDRDAVAKATPASPEFKGNFKSPQFATKGLNSLNTYYWRVDEVMPGQSEPAARGDVWKFAVRHLAFPGAEGYGRFARGGRGGRILEVTNLNDSGPGSLREAVDTDGPRTIVFRVGGTIQLKSKLVVSKPYCTIAGQTAPGDGICLRGFTVGAYSTHDVILRYLRIRVGDESGATLDGSGFGNCDNCIMDHCSISWSIDEAFSSRMAKNITLQRTIITEALNLSVHSHYVGTGKGHSFAGSISGDIGSFHHNLVVNCAGRNWSLAGGFSQGAKYAGRLDIRDNVVYNWAHRTNDGGVKALNLVNNLYIPGPASRVFHLLMPDAGSPQDPQQYYVAGNVMDGHPQYNADNWLNGGVKVDPRLVPQIKLSAPFCQPYVTTQSAEDAYKNVMADVGCNLPHYDAVDQRAIKDVIERTVTVKGSKSGIPGIIDSQKDVGGWPELKGGEAPADTDHDGIPDPWEKTHGLNPNDPSDANR